jgi:hypothetical protein
MAAPHRCACIFVDEEKSCFRIGGFFGASRTFARDRAA